MFLKEMKKFLNPRMSCPQSLKLKLIKRLARTIRTLIFPALENVDEYVTNHMCLHLFFRWTVLMRNISSQLKQIVPCSPLLKTLMRNDLLLERFALLSLTAIHNLLPRKQFVNPVRPRLRDTSTLKKEYFDPSNREEQGGDRNQLLAVLETADTTTESCPQGKRLGLSTVADIQRNSSSWAKGERRNFSSMTRVLSMIFAAGQQLQSSCAYCWNRPVRFRRSDLLDVCANSDSPLVEAQENAGEKACEPLSRMDMT